MSSERANYLLNLILDQSKPWVLVKAAVQELRELYNNIKCPVPTAAIEQEDGVGDGSAVHDEGDGVLAVDVEGVVGAVINAVGGSEALLGVVILTGLFSLFTLVLQLYVVVPWRRCRLAKRGKSADVELGEQQTTPKNKLLKIPSPLARGPHVPRLGLLSLN